MESVKRAYIELRLTQEEAIDLLNLMQGIETEEGTDDHNISGKVYTALDEVIFGPSEGA